MEVLILGYEFCPELKGEFFCRAVFPGGLKRFTSCDIRKMVKKRIYNEKEVV